MFAKSLLQTNLRFFARNVKKPVAASVLTPAPEEPAKPEQQRMSSLDQIKLDEELRTVDSLRDF